MTTFGPDLARHTVRAQPWGLLAAGWGVAALFGAVAHVDTEIELVTVTVAATIGVGSSLHDAASPFTDAVPHRRSTRRARSITPAIVGSLAVWLAIVVAVARFDSAPAPRRSAVVVWVAVVVAQVAVGSLIARRDRREPGVGPAALVGVVFLAPFVLPRLHGWFHPVGDHGLRWTAVIVAGMAVTSWAWRDPASPPRRRQVNPIDR